MAEPNLASAKDILWRLTQAADSDTLENVFTGDQLTMDEGPRFL